MRTPPRAVPAPARAAGPSLPDVLALAGAAAFVAAAAGAAVLLEHAGTTVRAPAAPLYGSWGPQVGPGTVPALAVAAAVVLAGPRLARDLPWRRALVAGYATAVAWTLSLALIDGPRRGLGSRLSTPTEYLAEVPGITDLGTFLPGFAARIPTGSPDAWNTHVTGHPPGATLLFVFLDRVGLGGGTAAALVCVLVGALAAVAVPVALRALGSEAAARAVLPFTVLFPGAVWVGASADGLFAGITACGVALLAVACARRDRPGDVAALAGGLLLGYGLYLSYGLTLMVLPVLAVALAARRVRPLLVGGVGVAAVVVVFTAGGFWWVEGYRLLVDVYHGGIAAQRPYGYWVLGNLAALLLCAGPLAARVLPLAIARVRPLPSNSHANWTERGGPSADSHANWTPAAALLVLGTAAAVLVADLSGLSKAETERIWLPFAVWWAAGAALLPDGSRRWWLAAQAGTALAVNHLVLTVW